MARMVRYDGPLTEQDCGQIAAQLRELGSRVNAVIIFIDGEPDEDRIREAMDEAMEHPGRIVTR